MARAKKIKTDEEDTNPEGKKPNFDEVPAESIGRPFESPIVMRPAQTSAALTCIVCGSVAIVGKPCAVDGYTN